MALRRLPFAPARHVRVAAITTVSTLFLVIIYTHTSILMNAPKDVDDMTHFLLALEESRSSGRTLQFEKGNNGRMQYSVHDEESEDPYEITKASLHTCFNGNRNVTIPQVPSFIIVGAQKSGTSSLFHYLLQHPNVIPTKKYVKKTTSTEMHFFDWHYVKRSGPGEVEFWEENNITNKEEFRCLMRQRYADFWETDELFASANGTLDLRVTFEKTPVYLFLPYVPVFIKETCPWLTKLVIILRNPIDRAYSHYWYEFGTTPVGQMEPFEERVNRELEYMRSKGLTQTPNITDHDIHNFDETTEFPRNNCTRTCEDKWFMQNYEENVPRYTNLLRGVYGMQLRQWLNYYSVPENLLVINYDDLHRDTPGVYRRILRHVGLPPHHLESLERSLRLSGLYRPMAKGTRRFLQKFYAPYNTQLADLLGEEWRGVWT